MPMLVYARFKRQRIMYEYDNLSECKQVNFSRRIQQTAESVNFQRNDQLFDATQNTSLSWTTYWKKISTVCYALEKLSNMRDIAVLPVLAQYVIGAYFTRRSLEIHRPQQTICSALRSLHIIKLITSH